LRSSFWQSYGIACGILVVGCGLCRALNNRCSNLLGDFISLHH
jgi:hypothetical protein